VESCAVGRTWHREPFETPAADHTPHCTDVCDAQVQCERAFSQATAQGAPTVMPVSTMFGQNVAMVKDPNGISVAIVSALRQD